MTVNPEPALTLRELMVNQMRAFAKTPQRLVHGLARRVKNLLKAEPAGANVAFTEGGFPVELATFNLKFVTVDELLTTNASSVAINVPEIYVDVRRHDLSILSDVPQERKFYESHTFRAPEMTLDRLEDQYWLPEYGF